MLLLHSYRNPAHEQRVQADPAGGAARRLRLRVARAEPGIPRVRARLDRGGQRLRRPARVGLPRRAGAAPGRQGLRRRLLRRAVDRRPVSRGARAASAACACSSPGPAAGVIGAQAICAQLGMGDAIAFDMGGTTAKAGVISEGRPLTTGSALIGGYERALPIQIPMMDIHEVGTGGGSIARVETGNALRVGPQSAGSIPGPGGLWPRRHRADRDRRQPAARPARRRSLPRRRAQARPRRLPEADARSRRQAAGAGPDRSRRRHPAHRGDADVARGEGGDHRARPRRRQLHDGGLRRRRPAARVGDRPRDRHPQGADPVRAGLLLGLRHAVLRPALRLRALGASASSTTSRSTRSRRSTSRWKTRAAPRSRSRASSPTASSSSAPPTCATSARSTPSRSTCRWPSSRARTARPSSSSSTSCTRCATAPRRRRSRPTWSSLRVTVLGTMKKPPKHDVDSGSAKPEKAALRAVKPVYFRSGGWADTPVYPARAAARRQPDLRSGPDRGARLHHRRAARRRAARGRTRQPANRHRERPLMSTQNTYGTTTRPPPPPQPSIRSPSRSSATACTPSRRR